VLFYIINKMLLTEEETWWCMYFNFFIIDI
jgi:hypothetical protein